MKNSDLSFLMDFSQCIIGLDEKGYILWVNKAGEALLGYSDPECLGKNWEQIVELRNETSGEKIRSPFQEALEVGEKIKIPDLILVSKSGLEIPVQSQFIPIRKFDSKSSRLFERTRVLVIAEDLREQKSTAAQQKVLEEKLSNTQKFETLGVIAGGIAHDFNNLITVILGNTSLSLDVLVRVINENISEEGRKVLLEECQSKIKRIENTAHKAQDLAKQLLSYSGKKQNDPQLTVLSHLVAEMGDLLRTSIPKKINIEYTFGQPNPVLRGDVTQLRQVIMNLMINAGEAIGDRKGTIRVETGHLKVGIDGAPAELPGLIPNSVSVAPNGAVVVAHSASTKINRPIMPHLAPGNYVFLEVSDTGCGMDRKTQQKIFDPLFTTKATGNGLGLAVVLNSVQAHKGAICLKSTPEHGTTFKVLFPASPSFSLVVEENESLKVQGQLTQETERAPATLLVVDDEGNILTMMKEVLEQGGFKVLTAETGRAGIKLYQERFSEIDAVLMDMAMSDMDGTEVSDEMRKVNSDVKVVLTSGYLEEDIISRLTAHGIKYFIQKPFMPQLLVQKMKEVTSRIQVEAMP